jgi:hypothetical protein
MQGKQTTAIKKCAQTLRYVSPNQLTQPGFETPFEQALTCENRWVKLSKLIPWDRVVLQYNNSFSKSSEGRQPISGRIVIGAVIIKLYLDISDRETVQQIQENMFMQYFLGYSSFTNEAPFSPSLFVEIRERLSLEVMNAINEIIVMHHFDIDELPNDTVQAKKSNPAEQSKCVVVFSNEATPLPSLVCTQKENANFSGVTAGHTKKTVAGSATNLSTNAATNLPTNETSETTNAVTNLSTNEINETTNAATKISPNTTAGFVLKQKETVTHKGRLLMDTTVTPQNITFPTDLKLLNAARVKSEELIDLLYTPLLHGDKKPRTYRQTARKAFLNIAKKKTKTAIQSSGATVTFFKKKSGSY